ncbi:hypothetical protein MMC13_007117 [Lambiella insularis]|nr:hypothetical protein [Lambiella insularis]
MACYGKTRDSTASAPANPANLANPTAAWAWPGRFLAPVHVDALIEAYKDYIAKDHVADSDSVLFDNIWQAGFGSITKQIADDPQRRRYAQTDKAVESIGIWSDNIRKAFCKGLNLGFSWDHTADIPSRRVPMEVGWAQNIATRLRHHQENSSTTYIWGFVNCWTRKKMPATIGKFDVPVQFTIFKVWDHQFLPNLAEVVASILCSSYKEEGGYNCTQAGTQGAIPSAPEYKENEDDVFLREPYIRAALLEDYYKQRLIRAAARPGLCDRKRQINDDLEAEIDATKGRITEMEVELASMHEAADTAAKEQRDKLFAHRASGTKDDENLRQAFAQAIDSFDAKREVDDWASRVRADQLQLDGVPENLQRLVSDTIQAWDISRARRRSVARETPQLVSDEMVDALLAETESEERSATTGFLEWLEDDEEPRTF